MKETDLIKCLTEFLTQNKFSDCIKSFDISKNYGDLKFNIVFDTNKLNKPETKEEKQDHVEVKVPEKKIEISDSSYENNEEPELDHSETSQTEIAYSASAAAIDEANEKFLAELDEKIEKEKQQKKPKSFLDDLDMKAVEAAQNQPVIEAPSKNKTNQLSNQKTTLYKSKVYTDDEITIINSYLQRECTGPEAAEMLGITTKAFYSLSQRYKRSSNIKSNRVSAEDRIKANMKIRTGSKLSLADLDHIYSQIKRGDTLSNCAKDYKVANSTLSIRLNKYIKANGLEPLFVNSRNTVTSTVKEKKKVAITVPKGTTDGWHMLDNQFHLVKDGVVIE